ncbi:MAG: beta-galactosidase [Candidatus Brockarchaeota archaeon]|nr:beta-galactosidase [Candidatus Brockarchaeota archaeon]
MSVVDFDENSLRINGKPVFIYSGEIHYFRVPRELWEDRLIKMKRAFLNSATIYFAWNWHEKEEGCFDFSGWRDVDEFLRLCEKHGLLAIARPGPYICSEWDFGGLPGWLIGRGIVPRSLDEGFMKHALRYYDHVIPEIRRHLATRGGSVILFQIENEYFWGNVPYLLRLYEAARERGVDVPIVHNVDRFLRGTQVIDSIDIYPDPWALDWPLNEAASIAAEQPGKPRMIMEFEGGWFTSFGGRLPTDRGDIPAEWTDMLLKTMVFEGFSLVSFYMFHGGTNFGYWTGKKIASTYDYQAAVREWGELGERYWAIRLMGGLLECFNEFFASSAVDKTLVECRTPGVRVSSRTRNGESFILVSNLNTEDVEAEITLKSLGAMRVKVGARKALVLPLNVKLANGWTLEFSTCQVFYSYDLNGRTVLILYGEPGEQHEATLMHPGGARETVSFKISEEDYVSILGATPPRLLLVALSRQRAARTWFAEHWGKRIAVVSGFSLLREGSSNGEALRMSIELKKNDDRRVSIIVPWRPRRVEVNGRRVSGAYDGEKWVYSFTLPEEAFKEETISLNEGWRTMVESVEEVRRGKWVNMGRITPPEALGMTGNGHIWYLNSFTVKPAEEKTVIFIPRVNDHVAVFLNGRLVGQGEHTLRLEVDKSVLRTGVNELLMLVESTGHRNDGLIPLSNGLNQPVYLGREEELALRNPLFKVLRPEALLKPGLPASVDYAMLLNRPLEVLPSEVFTEGWRRLESIGELAGQRGLILLKYAAELPEKPGKTCLVIPGGLPSWGRLIIIVNGKHVETIYADEGSVGVDVTRLVKPGANELIIILENFPDASSWRDPCLRMFDAALEDGWRVSQGLLGEREGWFKPGFEDSKWGLSSLSEALKRSGVVWLRRRFTTRVEENTVSPLMLRLRNTGSKCKIFLNGELIGRYMEKGPQTDFYMPEPFLKGENTLAIAVENYGPPLENPSIQILPYYVARRMTVELGF